jgi:hypothetical protein
MHVVERIKKDHTLGILLLVIIVGAFFITIGSYDTKLNSAKQDILNLKKENGRLAGQKDTLSKQVENMENQINEQNSTIQAFPHLDQYMLSQLKQLGFNGDENTIKEDLKKHNELIPYEGVLGGTMEFASKDYIYVLSNEWVFANFNDGHNAGYMLLSYKWSGKGLKWKVLDSHLPGVDDKKLQELLSSKVVIKND